VKIWESILETRPISIKHNFFELGGNSLTAVRLFAVVEHSFGKKLHLSTLLDWPTVEQLAVCLRNGEASNPFPRSPIAAGSEKVT